MVKRPTESGGEPSSSNCRASAGVKARHLTFWATSMKFQTCFLITALLLSSCASTVPQAPSVAQAPASPQVSFVDLPKFERQLSTSLGASFKTVNIAFYEKVSPNQVPERLQKWLSAVERSGGAVRVNPPPNEITPKDPLFLISLLGTLFNSVKNLAQIKSDLIFDAAQGRDALISLERNAKGEVIIGKIEFIWK